MPLGQRNGNKANEVTVLAYRFCGKPTEEQAHTMNRFIGSCRFLWNRMLAEKKAYYEETGATLSKTPASYKKEPGLEWLQEVDSLALANVQLRVESAYRRFFKSEAGYPRFKKKGLCSDSYTTNLASKGAGNIALSGNQLKLPKVPGMVKLKLHRQVKPGGVLKNVTVTREPSGKWYFSLTFEYPKVPIVKLPPKGEDLKHIGLDMSLPKLYIASDGTAADFSKPYRVLEKRIARE